MEWITQYLRRTKDAGRITEEHTLADVTQEVSTIMAKVRERTAYMPKTEHAELAFRDRLMDLDHTSCQLQLWNQLRMRARRAGSQEPNRVAPEGRP